MILYRLTLTCDLCGHRHVYEAHEHVEAIHAAFLDGWRGPGISVPPGDHLRDPVCVLAEHNSARLASLSRR